MAASEIPNASSAKEPVEFLYIYRLFLYRLKKLLGRPAREEPIPNLKSWTRPIRKFVVQRLEGVEEGWEEVEELKKGRDAALLLLVGLLPHAVPDLYDRALAEVTGELTEEERKRIGKLELPEIGGVHGQNFRGFLPTGKTAVFLLAGQDYEHQQRVLQLFDADYLFSKKKILWIEELASGEPFFHGRIILSQDYVDKFLTGKFKAPHFSSGFPAEKIDTKLVWDDLVINEEQKEQIGEIKNWIRYNETMIAKWEMGNRYRKGYKALFYGPPGTGKTLTAGLLGKYAYEDEPDANDECGNPRDIEHFEVEKQKDVYRVSLSKVVSKYIGETEKNLETVFARAEDKGWILFFDEADALFGKRTNVRDAHDKYANQEVSYLLQRIEEYNGLIILASNMKSNIDEAFLRRFNSIIKFQVPDAKDREKIWKRTFPQNAIFVEYYEDILSSCLPESIDIYSTIIKYELTGASILNVVQYACLKGIERLTQMSVLTADGDTEDPNEVSDQISSRRIVFLPDILKGIKKEMTKEGKPFQTSGG